MSALLFVLLVELINTAVEAVVDRVGTEFHVLAGLAKDLGSAAVFLALTSTIALKPIGQSSQFDYPFPSNTSTMIASVESNTSSAFLTGS